MILRVKICIVMFFFIFVSVLKCEAAEQVSGGDTTVNTEPIESVPVTELDLGDCPKEMVVGTSQMINVLVIPEDATDVKFTYTSANPEVASINALGRLTGKKVGTTQITVACGTVSSAFSITVIEDDSIISVQDIEIEVDKELKVDSNITINATVVPADATNAKIVYRSSDTQIATVNSSGQVKGVAPGQVIIEVQAGNIVKKIPLTVKIGTTGIQLNQDYLILKLEETFQLKAEIQPIGAVKNLTYKSLNPEVATVSSTGLVTAVACGDATIVVSNDDLQMTVSVIVNEVENKENMENIIADKGKKENIFSTQVSVKECPIVTSEMLKYFYEKEKVLTILGEGYTIYIDGKQIVNFDNQLITELYFQTGEDGLSFVVNEGKDLCGKIIINLTDIVSDYKYLYLYNEAKQKYEQLKVEDISRLYIDKEGRYLVATQKIKDLQFNPVMIVSGIIIVLVGLVAYIGVKKRYWFW